MMASKSVTAECNIRAMALELAEQVERQELTPRTSLMQLWGYIRAAYGVPELTDLQREQVRIEWRNMERKARLQP